MAKMEDCIRFVGEYAQENKEEVKNREDLVRILLYFTLFNMATDGLVPIAEKEQEEIKEENEKGTESDS